MHISSVIAVALALVRASLAEPGVTPASVKRDADPGTTFNINKVVTTFEIPPKPDVVLLVDVTGSMSSTIDNIKANLGSVISTVTGTQPSAQFAVVSFGDLDDGPDRGFKVVEGLTSNVGRLQDAVNSLSAGGGGDEAEDWINALFQIAGADAISFRSGSSPIVVLVGDAPSHDPSPPSGGQTLISAIGALLDRRIRVIAVDVGRLDGDGQASKVTSATGGSILPSDANKVSAAIVSGLSNIDVQIVPSVQSCSSGLSLVFNPLALTIGSGGTATFQETAVIAPNAAQTKSLSCTVQFLLNGTPGGPKFVQNVTVAVNQMGCFTCDPAPGKNKCHITTSCGPTPFGNQCLTRPGFKADGADDGDVKVQWRLKWPGHEHRVAVKPGTASNALCDGKNTGKDMCKEVKVAGCEVSGPGVSQVGGGGGWGQVVLGDAELRK
ncbi:hypothetical protein QBC39DRAFT_381923 [Podospora conica]|nr:hypothetical protein QBC39DRAFT_381923 [Schizothecium conicum]